MNHLTVLKHIK